MCDFADFAPSVLEAEETQCINLICLVSFMGPEGGNLNVPHNGVMLLSITAHLDTSFSV